MSQVMLVTGGSRGIGAAIARLAGRRGYAVAVNYASDAEGAAAVVADIRAGGGKAVALQADVSDSGQAAALFQAVDQQLGTVSAVVNNAGVIVRQCRADAMAPDLLERVFAVNVFGVFYCTREAIRRMSTRHGGRGGVILQISSMAAQHGGLPEETHYAASKGAIDSMIIGLAKEIGKEGVRVVGIRPGIIPTVLHEAHGGEKLIRQVEPTIPMGRSGSVDEVAETALWLASPAASYIHGTLVNVSGGR